MTEEMLVGFIFIVLLLLLLAFRVPVGIAMLTTGFVGFAWLRGIDASLGLLGNLPYKFFSSYTLTVAPLFILMGNLCINSGLSKDVFSAVNAWMGHWRGGLAIASIGACAIFAAVSGSSMATAVTIGLAALPEMKRYNYDDTLATGCVSVGGTLGSMIPPSIGMIIYGIITENSIGALLIAGIIPGITVALFYIMAIYIVCRRNPNAGPAGPRTDFSTKIRALRHILPIILLLLLVLGGIYIGIFTPNEAAGIGAFGALLIALARRITFEKIVASLRESIKITAMIMLIVAGAMVLNAFLAMSRLPAELAGFVSGLETNRYVILTLLLFIYLVLGCFMDALSMTLLTVPIFYPMILTLGFDPIWFGVMVVRMCEIGSITPPVGMVVYAIHSITPDVPLFKIFKGVIPFFIADILHTVIMIAVPAIVLFLPNLMR